MTKSLRRIIVSLVFVFLIGASAALTTGAAAEEPRRPIDQFLIQLFTGNNPAPAVTKQKSRVKTGGRVKPATPKVAAEPKIDPTTLRGALKDALAQSPDFLRGVIVDFVRNDQETRRMLAASAPKPETSPSAPAAPATADTPAAQPQPAPAINRGEIEKIVRDYLIAHPEVLQEAMAELEKRQSALEAEKHKSAVKEHAQALFSSPRQVVVGNPQGDVTFVEFFDYNCGYCKRAMEDMLALMKGDSKLKVVLKEFPVLGQGSVEAAQVAVAVRMQDKTGKKYLEFHQKLLSGRGQADRARALAVAKEIGMNMAQIEKDIGSAEVKSTLQESFKLAEALGLNGTPSYVIGDRVVIGAVGLPALTEKINSARCGKPSC